MLPSHYVDEACTRLRDGLTNSQWRKVLSALGMVIGDDEPDYTDLAASQGFEPVLARRGWIPLPATLELFGLSKSVHLRYVYVGEFGSETGDTDEFEHIGTVSRLEILEWPDRAAPPVWRPVDMQILSRAMLAHIDELVLEQERAKSNV